MNEYQCANKWLHEEMRGAPRFWAVPVCEAPSHIYSWKPQAWGLSGPGGLAARGQDGEVGPTRPGWEEVRESQAAST